MDYIYTLSDPRDLRVRYVGKTSNPSLRYRDHIKEKAHTHRTNWIQSLASLGLRPILNLIEQVQPDQNWEDRERYWIAFYRNKYPDLTNGTDGGDCGPRTKKGSKKSPETRAKMSAWQVGRKLSKKTRDRISRSNKGRKESIDRIEQKRKWMTGRKFHTDEFKKKLAERNRTRKYDPEIMRNVSRKLWDDPVKGAELRAKLIERNKKRKH